MKDMDTAYIEQHDIVHRYVQGALSAPENEAFEIYLMEHPELVEGVQMEQILKHTLSDLPDAHFTRPEKWWRHPFLFVGLGSAFATAATCLLAMYLLLFPALDPSERGGTAQIAYLEQMRSPALNNEGFDITLLAETQHVVMVLTPSAPQATSYHIYLMEQGRQIAGPFNAAPNDLQELSVSMPVSLLSREHYTLAVHPHQSENAELIHLTINRR